MEINAKYVAARSRATTSAPAQHTDRCLPCPVGGLTAGFGSSVNLSEGLYFVAAALQHSRSVAVGLYCQRVQPGRHRDCISGGRCQHLLLTPALKAAKASAAHRLPVRAGQGWRFTRLVHDCHTCRRDRPAHPAHPSTHPMDHPIGRISSSGIISPNGVKAEVENKTSENKTAGVGTRTLAGNLMAGYLDRACACPAGLLTAVYILALGWCLLQRRKGPKKKKSHARKV